MVAREESLKEGVIKLGKDLLETVGLIYEVVILVLPRAGARLQNVLLRVWKMRNERQKLFETKFGCSGKECGIAEVCRVKEGFCHILY